MSFTQITRRHALKAKRAAQRAREREQCDAQSFVTAKNLPERPASLMAAMYLVPIITIDNKTNEVLMISPRAEIPDHAN